MRTGKSLALTLAVTVVVVAISVIITGTQSAARLEIGSSSLFIAVFILLKFYLS